jgi:hypothetical protein
MTSLSGSSHVITRQLHSSHTTPAKMNVLILLVLIFLVPFIFWLVFLAMSSCMGDSFRASIAGIPVTFNPRHSTFGRQYTRAFGSGAGSAGWEQIEMEDMMGEDSDYSE